MALIEMNFANGGGTKVPTFSANQGSVPAGTSYIDVTIDSTKNYVLFWNLKSTETSDIYNGMWTLYKGNLQLVIGGSNSNISLVNTTTLRIRNQGSSTRGEYILAELE